MSALRIVGLCICAAGMFTVVIGVWLLRSRMDKARAWQSTEAEVLSSRAFVRQGTENDNCFTEYEVRYSVTGTPYPARFEQWSGSMDEAQAKAARHARGRIGKVSYDPANPQQIDANLGMNPATLSMPVSVIGGGVAAFLFGMAFVVMGVSSVRSADLW